MKSFSEKNLPTKRKSKSTDDLMRITSTATGGRGSGGHRKKLSNNGSILLIDTTTPALVKVGEGPAKRGSIHGSQGRYWLVLVGTRTRELVGIPTRTSTVLN